MHVFSFKCVATAHVVRKCYNSASEEKAMLMLSRMRIREFGEEDKMERAMWQIQEIFHVVRFTDNDRLFALEMKNVRDSGGAALRSLIVRTGKFCFI